jgi:signal transduction histidine kinase/ActR/RegA family two-component response regulator
MQRPAPVLVQATEEVLARHSLAAVVLVQATGTILHFWGQSERYLGPLEGFANLNILDMTTSTLSVKLRQAFGQALRHHEAVAVPHVTFPRAGMSLVNLTVEPLRFGPDAESLLAVVFADAAANQELRAANEEVMAMNEELQSAVEELEASQEELQAINEELSTVNSEVSEKVDELTAANDDLANLMSATEIATVFLDGQLRIKRFTPEATELLNLIPADLGRPVAHITQNFAPGQITADAETTLRTLSTIERDVRTHHGRWFTMRARPYRTIDDRIEGVVVTFSDVSRLRETQDKLAYERTYAESIVDTVRTPLLVLDERLHVLSANTAFFRAFQVTPAETTGQLVFDLGDRQWDVPLLHERLQAIGKRQSGFRGWEVEADFPKIGPRTMLLDARWIAPAGEVPARVLLAIEDITARKRDLNSLRDLSQELEQQVAQRTTLAEARAEQLREMATELTLSEQREKKRLARVLHDELQQLLVAARSHLVTIRGHVQNEPSQAAVDLVESLLNQSLEASRSLTIELNPRILVEAGLHAALPWLAHQMQVNHGLVVRTEMNARVEQDSEGVAGLLYQAVRELLLNIAKHAGVKFASMRLDRLAGDDVEIVVTDEGLGFEPTGLHSSNSSETGLGLFSIRERLKHLGGRCEIDSAPGRGTQIRLVVAVHAAGQSPRKPAALAAAKELDAASPPAAGTTRVLLVDDHAIVRQGLARLLNAAEGIAVVAEACDGEQAIDMARQHQPDVVVMDTNMPRMDGVEATRRIAAEMPQVRIVGLSMHAEPERIAALREAGAVGHLSKSEPFEELVAAIRRHAPELQA